jgi:GTP-binding protein HflX
VTEPRTPGEHRLARLAEPERDVASGTRTLVSDPTSRGVAREEGAGCGTERTQPSACRRQARRGCWPRRRHRPPDRRTLLAPLAAIRPATYLGKGKVEELAGRIRAEEIGLVVMDCALGPVQQRNLEKEWGAKVIDRTGLILEIFGRRARTREGALQVELAHLSYQKGRLVRSWTHLERQRGGFGFLGGPGETQIEADRRLIQERMTRIERDLETVKQTRELHRTSRRRVPYPIVALVGYTNAGKSTLFKPAYGRRRARREHAVRHPRPDLARDQAAAWRDGDPVRHGGFISDLPTMLIAAFRATLEDVIEADVLLHVRDVAHVETEAQSADVGHILTDLGIDPRTRAGSSRSGTSPTFCPETNASGSSTPRSARSAGRCWCRH